ncbi:RTA1-domain-containing protein [Serendipita vermifera]|nr:RTA1-domain-containing protein [Serendipita vermifera]
MASSGSSHAFIAFKQYEPNEAACIVFIVVFGLLVALHLWRSFRAKVWYMWPLIVSTMMEWLGYLLREYSIHNRTKKGPYLTSQVLIIVSPACLAVQLYMLIGKTMEFVGIEYSLIRPSWIAPIFLGIDILSIIAQAAGSAILFNQDASTSIDQVKTGRAILIVGLFIQLVGFSVFLFLSIFFDRKTHVKLGKRISLLRPLMNAFYIAGALILIRSIYRAVEFITIDLSTRPVSGYLWNTEWPYYVLDALPIALSVLVYLILFPPNYLPSNPDVVLHKDEEVALSSNEVIINNANGDTPYRD